MGGQKMQAYKIHSRLSGVSKSICSNWRYLSTTKMAPIQAGDAIPNVDLFEGAPDQKVNLADECKSGKYVIFGVPGAFTPGCSKTHLPGYVSSAEDLKAKGIKDIFCVAVNYPFVMAAWGSNQNADGKVHVSRHLWRLNQSYGIRIGSC